MGLELELDEHQYSWLKGFSRVAKRGYILVRDEGEKLVATKIISVPGSEELMLLSELQQIEIWSAEVDGYVPYVRSDCWTEEHRKCANAFYKRLTLLDRCAKIERGINAPNISLKGFGMFGEKSKFYRFVGENTEEMQVKIKGNSSIKISEDSVWLSIFYYSSKL